MSANPVTTDAPEGRADIVRAYVELTKPRIIELLLTTTVPAMILAAEGWPGTWLVLATLVGGALSAGGANTINQVVDADIDRIMARTKSRPLPTDRIDSRNALLFGAALGAFGFVWLVVTVNMLAAVLTTLGLLFYVFVYTLYLKRSSAQNIVVGGAAGAVPALVGWAAVTGTLALPAWIMFAIIFFWTPPHFWTLAIRYHEDYAAADVPMLPVVVGDKRALEHIVAYSAVLVGTSFLLIPTGVVGLPYTVAAVVLGVGVMAATLWLRRHHDQAIRYFLASNVYLAALFAAMAIDGLF
ncbi:MAG: protoheme IX farnesyltransferase [bacterium]|nr:protoheme IX farnesyltransferase [bacterium]